MGYLVGMLSGPFGCSERSVRCACLLDTFQYLQSNLFLPYLHEQGRVFWMQLPFAARSGRGWWG